MIAAIAAFRLLPPPCSCRRLSQVLFVAFRRLVLAGYPFPPRRFVRRALIGAAVGTVTPAEKLQGRGDIIYE